MKNELKEVKLSHKIVKVINLNSLCFNMSCALNLGFMFVFVSLSL